MADANFPPDYVSSSRSEGVSMGQVARRRHGYTTLNVSVPMFCSEVESSIYTKLPSWMLFAFINSDTLVFNNIMTALPWQDGFLASATTSETWSWTGLMRNDIFWSLNPSVQWNVLFLTDMNLLKTFPFIMPKIHLSASTAWILFLAFFSFLFLCEKQSWTAI